MEGRRRVGHLRKKLMGIMAAGAITGTAGTAMHVQDATRAEASWFLRENSMLVIDVAFEAPTSLAAGDEIVLSFPDVAQIADASAFARVTGQTSPTRINDAAADTVTIVLDHDVLRTETLSIILDEVSADTTHLTYAVALNINAQSGAALAYGIATPQQGTATAVSASVPLTASVGVDIGAIDLGTLSPLAVSEGRQHYSVYSNNATGVRVQIQADGPLRDPLGNAVANVADGRVTAGVEEYGVTVENVQNVLVNAVFAGVDQAVPETLTDISMNTAPVHAGSFDLVYRASIDAQTEVGNYGQTVYFTIVPNV